jgi:hypothetical protein
MNLLRATITICQGCVDGDGQQCRSPGCMLYGHMVDLPINVDEPVEIAEVPDVSRAIEPLTDYDLAWQENWQ